MKKNRKYMVSVAVLVLLIVGYLVADTQLFDGVRGKVIHKNGFQANYFVKENTQPKVTVLLIGGGQWGDYWAQQFATKDMVGLSIPYIGKDGLPRLAEEIELEYFENALNWLRKQPEVDPNKIVVMGASRNAELALIIAATFPKMISGVVGYAPSSVSWPNTVLPYSSNDLKPSWKYKGVAIPYIPMPKLSGNETDQIEMLAYWKTGLAKTDFAAQASIKVERIGGPILLFSGNDDQVWPSSQMADMIGVRLHKNSFEHPFQHIKYEDAGHLISNNPEGNSMTRIGSINIDGKNYEYEFGGTREGDFKAKQDAPMKSPSPIL